LKKLLYNKIYAATTTTRMTLGLDFLPTVLLFLRQYVQGRRQKNFRGGGGGKGERKKNR